MNAVQPIARRRSRPEPFPSAMPTHVMSVDIETISDPEVPAPANEGFPKPIRHKIVCISVAVARIDRDAATGALRYEVEEIRSGGDPSWNERRLLKAFWTLLGARPLKIVGWNSRRFDIPTILTRSLIYGLDAGIYWSRGDRWTNYEARYNETWACDVMDALAARGAAPAHGLDEVAVALGLPGKMGEHGSAVADMVAAGDIVRVRRYCETDTVNCLAVFFYYERLAGRLDEAGLEAALDSLRCCLVRDPEGSPHLAEFARRWAQRSKVTS